MKIPGILLVEAFHNPDHVFNRHCGGETRMQPTLAITTQQILCDSYPPGVARVCRGARALEELLPDPLNLDTHRAVTVAVRAAVIEPVSTEDV